MRKSILSHPEVAQAVRDLKSMLLNIKENIEDVILFGSAVKTSPDDARDIDFFIAYKDMPFQDIRSQLLALLPGRRVIVENVEANYTNHPQWPKEEPLPIHIILYRKGISNLSEKLEKAKRESVDISSEALS